MSSSSRARSSPPDREAAGQRAAAQPGGRLAPVRAAHPLQLVEGSKAITRGSSRRSRTSAGLTSRARTSSIGADRWERARRAEHLAWPLALEAPDPPHAPRAAGARASRRRPEAGRAPPSGAPPTLPRGAPTRRVIARCVRRDSNCIDIGAHIGATLSTLLRLAPEGRHLAFEPLPEKAQLARAQVPRGRRADVALSDRPGTVDFLEDLSRAGFQRAGVRGRPRARDPPAPDRGGHARPRRPGGLPAGLREARRRGLELAVLRGGRETIERAQPRLLFERGPAAGDQRGGALRLRHRHARLLHLQAERLPRRRRRRSRARPSPGRRSTRSRPSTSSPSRVVRVVDGLTRGRATRRRARRASGSRAPGRAPRARARRPPSPESLELRRGRREQLADARARAPRRSPAAISQPSTPSLDELGDAGDLRGDHGPVHRQRLHHHDGQPLGQARQHQRARARDLLAAPRRFRTSRARAGDRRARPARAPPRRAAGRHRSGSARSGVPRAASRRTASISSGRPFSALRRPTKSRRGAVGHAAWASPARNSGCTQACTRWIRGQASRRREQHALAAAEVADAGGEGRAVDLAAEAPGARVEEDARAVLGQAVAHAREPGRRHRDAGRRLGRGGRGCGGSRCVSPPAPAGRPRAGTRSPSRARARRRESSSRCARTAPGSRRGRVASAHSSAATRRSFGPSKR